MSLRVNINPFTCFCFLCFTSFCLLVTDHYILFAEQHAQISQLRGEMKNLKDKHQQEMSELKAQLNKEKAAEMSEMKAQLSKEKTAEMSELRNAKGKLDARVQQLQEALDAAKADCSDIAAALRAKEEKIKGWELQAQAIDFQYDSTLQSLCLPCLTVHVFYLTHVSFCSGSLPYTASACSAAVNEQQNARLARGERIQTSPFQMEDYLTSFSTRLEPLVSRLSLMEDANLKAYTAMFPDADAPDDAGVVARTLADVASSRMELYCTSSARLGADDALATVLSWYEGIELDVLKGFRDGSKWLTDPNLVAQRRAAAIDIAQYTNTNILFLTPEEEAEEPAQGVGEGVEVDDVGGNGAEPNNDGAEVTMDELFAAGDTGAGAGIDNAGGVDAAASDAGATAGGAPDATA
jgi:multidrug efflux pump subunit AcrA (membrane-fusion protein)